MRGIRGPPFSKPGLAALNPSELQVLGSEPNEGARALAAHLQQTYSKLTSQGLTRGGAPLPLAEPPFRR